MASLTAGELEVMQVLWAHGELKPSQIQDRYPRPIRNAALRFQLRILLDKGHVVRRKVGKAYFYKAATARRGVFKTMAKRMADVFCQGSRVGLIAELIEAEDMTREQIEELKSFAGTRGPANDGNDRKGKKS